MKKFRELSEQHREKGRFKPTIPHNVSSTPGGTPRETSDSANVKLREAIKDKYDIGEYDQEGDMAKSDLRSIIANSKRVHDMLKDDDNLPEWVQSKITKAEDYMSTVANYLEAEMNEAVKMPKQTRAEKEYRRITGKTVDQRLSELDKIQKNLAKQREDYIKQGIIKAESVEELDEALRHEIAGQVARFIGNKIDPVHGDIMHAHGKEAYRQAAYHIRGTIHHVSKAISDLHDRLHKHLRTGTLTMEEIEELDEGKYGAFRVRMTSGGPKLPRRGYGYVPQGDTDPRTGLPLGFSHPPKKDEPKKVKEEVEQIDEISAEVSKRVAQARDKSAENYKLTPTQSRRLGMGDKGGEPDLNAAKALKSAMKRGAKNVYGEEVESLEEKNVPTSPEKWARAKAQAKAKFDVYPSAYANGWAAKKYKEMGGGWKSVSEDVDLEEGYFKNQEIERQETERLAKRNEPPFTPDKPKKKSVVVGKKPEGYSRARQLARQAIQKYKTPVKEAKEVSRKAQIVKDTMKKATDEDKFQAKPELGDSLTKNL